MTGSISFPLYHRDGMQILNFTDHRRQLLQNQYVYAVVSRRAKGLSIGINLNVDKVCNFDCPYCQVNRRVPLTETQEMVKRTGVDVLKVQSELAHLFSLISSGELWSVAPFDTADPAMRTLKDVSISGDGEPTACPELLNVVGVVSEQLDQYQLSEVAFNLFTNATLFHKFSVKSALEALWKSGGRVWAKLDAGTQSWFERVDGTKLSLEKVTQNIMWASKQHPIVLQCMFHRFGEERPSTEEIDAWVNRVCSIVDAGGQVDWVQIYTTARKPSEPSVLPLEKSFLQGIADRLLSKLGGDTTIRVTVSA